MVGTLRRPDAAVRRPYPARLVYSSFILSQFH